MRLRHVQGDLRAMESRSVLVRENVRALRHPDPPVALLTLPPPFPPSQSRRATAPVAQHQSAATIAQHPAAATNT